MKIVLKGEMETLLIALYGKARMSKRGVFNDPDAERAIEQIDYDFAKLRIMEKTQIMLSIRASRIDDFTARHLREHPGGTVVYLGCGLDARARRLNVCAGKWYDLDFPQVIDIKKQLYEETDFYKYIPSSVTDWEWMDCIEFDRSPVLVIAEGLLMYLKEQDVQSLFEKMRDKFGDVVFIFDAYSNITAKRAKNHPSLKRTGAVIRWGVDSYKMIEAFGSGIVHKETFYLTEPTAISELPPGYRMLFKWADAFKSVKEAHRIFVMEVHRWQS